MHYPKVDRTAKHSYTYGLDIASAGYTVLVTLAFFLGRFMIFTTRYLIYIIINAA